MIHISNKYYVLWTELEIIKQYLPYNVIAIQPYQAKHDNEISFMKDEKFDVVDKMTDLWLIGDINGTRGLFPAYCVEVLHFIVMASTV